MTGRGRKSGLAVEIHLLRRSFEHRQKLRATRHEEDDDWMAHFGLRIAAIETQVAAQGGGGRLSRREIREYRKWKKRLDEFMRQGRQAAEDGVEHVCTERREDGSAQVTLDRYPPVELTPTLVELLEVLAEDCGTRTDALVGWKTMKHVQKALAKRLGRPMGVQAVCQSIRRLKDALETRIWIGEFLVGRKPRIGYRFLKRARAVPRIQS